MSENNPIPTPLRHDDIADVRRIVAGVAIGTAGDLLPGDVLLSRWAPGRYLTVTNLPRFFLGEYGIDYVTEDGKHGTIHMRADYNPLATRPAGPPTEDEMARLADAVVTADGAAYRPARAALANAVERYCDLVPAVTPEGALHSFDSHALYARYLDAAYRRAIAAKPPTTDAAPYTRRFDGLGDQWEVRWHGGSTFNVWMGGVEVDVFTAYGDAQGNPPNAEQARQLIDQWAAGRLA